MKKTLAAVLAAGALLIGGIGSVDAANWYTVGTDSNGITWSIDNDSVKKDDKKATLDIKAMDYEGYHYIVTEEFNHKKREVKDVKVTLYNPKGLAEPHGEDDACQQRVYHYVKPSVHRPYRACKAAEYLRPSDELYHERRGRTGITQSRQLPCAFCQ